VNGCVFLHVDSGFGRILDVFVDPPTAVAIIILVVEHHARRNGRAEHNVCSTSITTRFRVRGPPRHG